MFNKDYEVYDSEIAKDKRWLFLNRSGGGFSSEAFIDLENYVRDPDAEDPKKGCLLYTSPSPRDATLSRMPSSA